MASLREALAAIVEADGNYLTAAPEGWTQGRTLYGGMTVAMSAHVAGLFAPALPPLRSVQFSFVGPAAGDLVFRPQLLRQGRSSAVVGVDCLSKGQLAARGLMTYGAPRESAIRGAARHDRSVPAPQDCEPFFSQTHGGPSFFKNFELRLAAGSRLDSGPQAAPEFEVWIRHRDDEGVDPTVALLALADGLPPAAMTQFPSHAPISTMTWTVDLAQPLLRRGWHLSRSVAEASADGYSQQAMEVFDRDGSRVAAGRQTVAIFV